MSRFSQYDSDSERLPEGMTRVGYDADTQTYTYKDSDGSYWEGPAGARYGRLRRVDVQCEMQPLDIEQDRKRTWRYMKPFFVLCGLFLLAVFWFLNHASSAPIVAVSCGEDSFVHIVKSGESCWAIAERYGISLETIRQNNVGLDCDKLQVGQDICVPITSLPSDKPHH
jgi:LysM domain